MPDGMPFVAEALRRGLLTRSQAKAFAADPRMRVSMIHFLLTDAAALPWSMDVAVTAVSTQDFGLLEVLALREQLDESQVTQLLTLPTPQVRAVVALAILAEAALSYLGLGTPRSVPTWGNMLRQAQDQLFSNPLQSVWPGLAIALAVLGFNLLGDGLRDYLDPRLREVA